MTSLLSTPIAAGDILRVTDRGADGVKVYTVRVTRATVGYNRRYMMDGTTVRFTKSGLADSTHFDHAELFVTDATRTPHWFGVQSVEVIG